MSATPVEVEAPADGAEPLLQIPEEVEGKVESMHLSAPTHLRVPHIKGCAIRAGLLFAVAFLAGYFSLSVFWVIILASLIAYDTYRKNLAQKRRARMKIINQAHLSKELKLLLGNFPRWVQFPDTEKSDMLNQLLIKLWPYAKKATEQTIRAALDPVLAVYKPPFLTTFALTKSELSPNPPKILGVNTIVTRGPDGKATKISLDLTLKLSGDSDIVIEAGTGPAVVSVKVQDLEVTGVFRLTFAPLFDGIPGFKAVTAAFTSTPNISFKLKALAAPLSAIPKFGKFLDEFISETLGDLLALPERIVIPLARLVEEFEGMTPEEQAECLKTEGCTEEELRQNWLSRFEMMTLNNRSGTGMLRVTIKGARNLKNVDKFGKSDPYCSMKVAGVKRKTTVKENDLNPTWNETFDWMLVDPTSQRLDVWIKDDDVGSNKVLGELSLSLARFVPNEENNLILPLESGTGELEISLKYLPFVQMAADGAHTLDLNTESDHTIAGFFVMLKKVEVKKAGLATFSVGSTKFKSLPYEPDAEPYQTFSWPLKHMKDKLEVDVGGASNFTISVDIVSEVLTQGTHGLEKEYVNDDGSKVELFMVCKYVDDNAIPVIPSDPTADINHEETQLAAEVSRGITVVQSGARGFALLFITYVVSWLLNSYFILGLLFAVAAGVAYTFEAHKNLKARYVLELERPSNRINFDRSAYDDPPLAVPVEENSDGDKKTDSEKEPEKKQKKVVIKGDQKLPYSELLEVKSQLPRWYSVPNVEKAEWLNEFVEALWPYLAEGGRKMVLGIVDPLLNENKPGFMSDLSLHTVHLGTNAPIFSAVQTFTPRKLGERFIIDLDLFWATDLTVSVRGKAGPASLTVTVRDFSIQGTLRIEMTPLITVYPCFAGMNISFTKKPEIDLNVFLSGIPLLSVPGLRNTIMGIVDSQIAPMLVYPSVIEVPMIEYNSDMLISALASGPPGAGILRVRVVKATDLANVDMLGKSDPYVNVILHDSPAIKKKTKVIDNNLNPTWTDENFEFIVKDDKALLTFEVKDYDKVGSNKSLGEGFVRLGDLLPDVRTAKVFDLQYKGKQKGKLHTEIIWKPFTPEVGATAPVDYPTVNKKWATACVFVNINHCKDLNISSSGLVGGVVGGVLSVVPGKQATGKQPYVEVAIGNDVQRTAEGVGSNPVFHEVLTFFVHDTDNQRIRLKVRDNDLGKDSTLGTLTFELADLAASGFLSDTWQLDNASHGEITMSVFLRTVEREDTSMATAIAHAAEVKERSLSAPESPKKDLPPGVEMPIRPGYLTVTMNRGRNLPRSDSSGFSDPYVNMFVEGHKQKTKVIKRDLNPVFDQTFQFRVEDPLTAELELHVKDHNSFLSGNKQLADPIVMSIKDMVPGSTLEKEVGLTGTISLTVSYANDKAPKRVSEADAAAEAASPKKKGSALNVFHRKSTKKQKAKEATTSKASLEPPQSSVEEDASPTPAKTPSAAASPPPSAPATPAKAASPTKLPANSPKKDYSL